MLRRSGAGDYAEGTWEVPVRTTVAVSVLFGGLASVAAAQPTVRVPAPLEKQELAFGLAVVAASGSESATLVPHELTWAPGPSGSGLTEVVGSPFSSPERSEEPRPTPRRPGVGLIVSAPGWSVVRARFATPADALEWASTSTRVTTPDPIAHRVEVIGRQVVLIEGDVVLDAARLEALRAAAWSELPGGDGRLQLRAVAHGGHVRAEVFLPEGRLYAELSRTLPRVREQQRRTQAAGIESSVEWRGESAFTYRFRDGTAADVEVTRRGASVVFAPDGALDTLPPLAGGDAGDRDAGDDTAESEGEGIIRSVDRHLGDDR